MFLESGTAVSRHDVNICSACASYNATARFCPGRELVVHRRVLYCLSRRGIRVADQHHCSFRRALASVRSFVSKPSENDA
jgi:hypothetical protein